MKTTIFQEKLTESFQQFGKEIAIQRGDREFTYMEVDRKSNVVANWIAENGIKKGTFIGILTHDRIDYILLMVGILKAGCVFVALDAAMPRNRLEAMIVSTHTSLIFADDESTDRLGGSIKDNGGQSRFVRIGDLLPAGVEHESLSVSDSRYSPDDQIYIYFTSGSTGQPRAIVGKNKSLLHFVDWEIETFNIDKGYRFSQFTSTGFDAFLRDVFVPILSGGVVCIPEDDEVILSGEKIEKWIDRNKISVIHCVPSLFRLINSNKLNGEIFRDLKYVLLSGEKVNPSDLSKWYETFDNRIQLVNLYGPTETTMTKTYYLIEKSDTERKSVPIGKPMRGVRIILLDRNMNVCKPETEGEIYIRTPFRTYGYYDEPELNAQRFIPNPFNDKPEDLIYKTGDLGRLLPDGNLEFLGRKDRQVKVRGFRIELEEIENTLARHPVVNEAAVIKKENAETDMLFAYVTLKSNGDGDNERVITTLMDYLAGELPENMIPAQIIEIDKMPLMLSGKIDYSGLPDPFKMDSIQYVPPRNQLEEGIEQIWSEILGIEKIGVKKSFFELGGNSLNVMSLISRLHREYDIRIPIGDIFNNVTIEKQAEIIRAGIKQQHEAIDPVEMREYYAVSSAQKRLYIVNQIEGANTNYNLPSAVQVKLEFKKGILEKMLKELIERHESLRTSFPMIDNEPVQRVHQAVDLEVEYFEATEGEVMEQVKAFVRPFELSQAPLLRVGVITLNETRFILMVDMHHIIADDISHSRFVNELNDLYRGNPLPDLKLQYRDFSEWQNNLFKSNELRMQEDYWLNRFKGDIPVLDLKTDFERTPSRNRQGDIVDFEMSSQLTDKVRQVILETDVTLYIFLLSVYNVCLSLYSGQEDIVVGTGIAGRRHADLENIIGMFINMLPMRNFPEADKTFRVFLEEVKANSINAFENQDYQFEMLVNKLEIKRDPLRHPLFDVVFGTDPHSMKDIDSSRLQSLKNRKFSTYEFEFKIGRFDLWLLASELKDKMFLRLGYSNSLFKQSTVEKIANWLIEVLEQVVDNLDIKLGDIKMSSTLRDIKTAVLKEDLEDFVF